MSTFQILGIALFASLITANLSRMIRRRSIPRSSIAWLCIWSVGVVALLAPNEMTRIARALGVSRGADLLLYVSVVSGLLIAFVIYTQMRQTNRQITLIVRELALNTVDVPADFAAAGFDPFETVDTDDSFFASATTTATASAAAKASGAEARSTGKSTGREVDTDER